MPPPPSLAVFGSTTVSARPATSSTRAWSSPHPFVMNRLTPSASLVSTSPAQRAQSAIGKNGCPSTRKEPPLACAVGGAVAGGVATWRSVDSCRPQVSTAYRESAYEVDGARLEKTVLCSVASASAAVHTVGC